MSLGWGWKMTAEKILQNWVNIDDEDDEEDGDLFGQLKTLTADERSELQRFMRALEANRERDPKYHIVKDMLPARRAASTTEDRGTAR